MSDRVRRFYDDEASREWERSERHPVEFELTLRALEDHLPPPPASIADVGGAVGRYAINLTQRGYDVTLVDISQGCLDLAKVKAAEAGVDIARLVQADARDLQVLADCAFDAVLLMGPLYHLLEHEQRLAALAESRRILRAGGLIFAAFINRLAILNYGIARCPGYLHDLRHEWEEIISAGTRYPLEEPVKLVLTASRDGQEAIELVIGEVEESAGGLAEVMFGERSILMVNGGVELRKVITLNDQDGARTVARLDPPGRAGEDRVEVAFMVDVNRTLRVTVVDLLNDEMLLDSVPVVELR